MKNIILFDNDARDNFLPFTFIRPVCELFMGLMTNRERWERWLGGTASYITQEYLSEKYDIVISERNYIINGAVIPNQELCKLIEDMDDGNAFIYNDELIAAALNRKQFERLMEDDIDHLSSFELKNPPFLKLDKIWDLFTCNAEVLKSDIELLTHGRHSQQLSATNTIIGTGTLFVEEGAVVEGATINLSYGPVYIGKNAEVMEGALIRGALGLCEGGRLKMGAKVYGATSIGPHSVAGGEVKNVVMFAHSQKGHEGYLGNSVIGEWCNLGADTNSSNLKNNWSRVKIWNYASNRMENSGQLKAGLFMGDFSMCGINTMFNTGTVTGVCCNIFGGGFSPKFIPSYSWGGGESWTTHLPEKAFQTIERMMQVHGKELSIHDRLILMYIFEQTSRYRNWENSDDKKNKFF